MAMKDGRRNEEKSVFWLFQNSPVFTEDVIFGDFFWYTFGHADVAPTENEDFIGIKNGITVLVKKDEFIAVFFSDLLAEFSHPCVVAFALHFLLLFHPNPKGSGEGHK